MKNFRTFCLCSVVYRILLDAIYIWIIVPYFAYDGLVSNVTTIGYILSWVLFLIFVHMTWPFLKRENKITSNLAVLLFLMKMIPLTSYIACNAQPLHFVLLQTVYFSLILLFFNTLPPICITGVKPQNLFVNIITFVFVATIVFISGYYTHFRLHFTLNDVYGLRMEARGYNVPVVLQYIHGAAIKILPILLIYYLEKKYRIIPIIIVFALLLSFGIDGMKSTFFNLILCLCFYFVFMRFKHVLFVLPLGMVFLCILAGGEYIFNQSYSITSLFIRRIFFIPVHLDTIYYQYALDYGCLHSHPLDGVDISFVIGELWRTGQTRANNGLFSDAFINWGTLGVVIYPIFYAIFFKWADSVFAGKDQGIIFYASFIMAYNLMGSFFSVCLLTHGMFLLCLTAMFMPTERNPHKITHNNEFRITCQKNSR